MARGAHPYVLILDDIRKDEKPHRYDAYLEISPDIEFADAPGGTGYVLTSPTPVNEVIVSGSLFLQVLCPADAKVSAEDYEVPGHSRKPEKRRRIVVSSTTVQPDFRLFFAPLRKDEAPPALSFDTKTGSLSASWPDQKDIVISAKAKEGFTQMVLKRERK